MAAPLYILGPNFSREQAVDLRRLFAGDERRVVFGWAGGHTAGQEIQGDVVVIGDGARTAEQDARGTFKRYATMDEFRQAVVAKEMQPAPMILGNYTPRLPPSDDAADSAPQPKAAEAQAGPDKFEGMDRVQLIRYGAERFPRQRQWATLDSEKLKVELRKLEAAAS